MCGAVGLVDGLGFICYAGVDWPAMGVAELSCVIMDYVLSCVMVSCARLNWAGVCLAGLS